jgi:hypothetical protein
MPPTPEAIQHERDQGLATTYKLCFSQRRI